MKVKAIREVSIAVKNLDEAIEDFRQKLQIEPEEVQIMAEAPIQSRWASFRIGDCSLALMESTADGSPIERFIQRRGEGVFSVTLSVENITDAMAHLKTNGVDTVLPEPMVIRDGKAVDRVYRENHVNFTLPRSLHGVVFEIQELRD